MRPPLPSLLVLLLAASCAGKEAPEPAVAADSREDSAESPAPSPEEDEALAESEVHTVRAPRTRRPSAEEDGGEDTAPEGQRPSPDPGDTPAEGAPEEPEEAPPASPPGGRDDGLRPPPKGLVILANDRWHIPRRLADRWEAKPYRLARAVQVDNGWKLRRVRPGGPGWWLGLRNGDVLLEVNGMKLNNKVQQAAAYVALRKKTEFVVTLRRNGKIRKHRYVITE